MNPPKSTEKARKLALMSLPNFLGKSQHDPKLGTQREDPEREN